jgi:hypothetical protein
MAVVAHPKRNPPKALPGCVEGYVRHLPVAGSPNRVWSSLVADVQVLIDVIRLRNGDQPTLCAAGSPPAGILGLRRNTPFRLCRFAVSGPPRRWLPKGRRSNAKQIRPYSSALPPRCDEVRLLARMELA